jgi:hypothetical protein
VKTTQFWLVALFAFALAAPLASHAEIVSVTTDNGQRFQLTNPLTESSVNGSGRGQRGVLDSRLVTYTTELDTVADTARLTQADFDYVPSARTVTFQFPGNFPNPAIAITESFSFDPISLETPHLSATTSPLFSAGGTKYIAGLGFDLLYADSFVVSGTYRLQGPTESATVPFSVTYNRLEAPTNTGGLTVNIDTGNNFPATAEVTTQNLFVIGRRYDPSSTLIFDGTIDGIPFTSHFVQTTLWRFAVPEPSGLALGAIGRLAMIVRGRGRRDWKGLAGGLIRTR